MIVSALLMLGCFNNKKPESFHNEESKKSKIYEIELDKKRLDNRIKIEREAEKQKEVNSQSPYISSFENELFKMVVDHYFFDIRSGTPRMVIICEFKNLRKIIRPKTATYYSSSARVYTDGVTEALNAREEEFGLARLVDLLQANAQSTASQILYHLQDAVLSFSAYAPQHDDITMMVLGYRESLA